MKLGAVMLDMSPVNVARLKQRVGASARTFSSTSDVQNVVAHDLRNEVHDPFWK